MARQAEGLLDILIRLFADKLLTEARRGLPRAYLQHEDDLPALRGRLNAVRQFTVHAVRPDRLACRFDALSSDIPLLQIMKACVLALRRHARVAETVRKLDELRFVLADIADVSIVALPWHAVQIDRTNRRWEALFGLARLFLKRDWQATHHDPSAEQGITLLFPMNDLFEAYIAVLMRRSLRPVGLSVETQGGRLFCLIEEETRGAGDRPARYHRSGPPTARRSRSSIRNGSACRRRSSMQSTGSGQTDVYQMMAYGAALCLLRPLSPLSAPFRSWIGSVRYRLPDPRQHGSAAPASINTAQREVSIVADLAAMFRRWRAQDPVVSG
jgi:5-methylcytosine-specific restriction enzyme subunit McrC